MPPNSGERGGHLLLYQEPSRRPPPTLYLTLGAGLRGLIGGGWGRYSARVKGVGIRSPDELAAAGGGCSGAREADSSLRRLWVFWVVWGGSEFTRGAEALPPLGFLT